MRPSGDALVDHFRMMARNNRWANQRLFEACLALGTGEFDAHRVSFFPSLRETLAHNYTVDQYYLDAMEEGGLGNAVRHAADAFETPDALARAQDESDLRLISFCDASEAARLAATVMTDRGEDGIVAERVDYLLAHLFQHQIHHRGQAHAMLAGTRIAPPQLDEFFLDYDRHPAASRILAD